MFFQGLITLVVMFQIRDYIHVQDLATGHSAALHKLFTTPDIGANLRVPSYWNNVYGSQGYCLNSVDFLLCQSIQEAAPASFAVVVDSCLS